MAMFFTPKWKKETDLLLKGAQKFLHYKRDLLKQDRIDEIESRLGDLRAALKAGNRDGAAECSKQLRATCENALPHHKAPRWFEENVEVIFVALVVALGLRSYIIQPFRIPTGSMQPTLNGIIATTHTEKDYAQPWIGKQVYDWALRGRRWHQIKAPTSGRITGRADVSKLFFSRTKVFFDDGSSIVFPAPVNETDQAINGGLSQMSCIGKSFKKGDVMFQGTVDGGDLVLVDKISYHFRKPVRGEVFVFDTLGIERRIGKFSGSDQAKATHYIKRLCGVPGDTLSIDSPHLFVNGKIASEKGIGKVFELPNQGRMGGHGYSYGDHPLAEILKPDDELKLAAVAPRGMREYAALGDNSGNSLDSRYWGTVKEFNLVGPALFSLWPITTGHWGFIK
ncbi:MAG: signal peptidase [Verrucomicrobiota bacterium]